MPGASMSFLGLLGRGTNWVASSGRNVFSRSSGGQKSEIEVSRGHAPSEDSRAELCSPLPVSGGCWQPLVFLCLWRHHFNLFFHRHLAFSFYVCVLSALLIRMPVIMD